MTLNMKVHVKISVEDEKECPMMMTTTMMAIAIVFMMNIIFEIPPILRHDCDEFLEEDDVDNDT